MKKFFKGLSTVLFGMHFWLPIVYSLIFLMIAAISGTMATAWPFYFLGLAIAFAGSLLLVYFLKDRKLSKGKKSASTAEVALTSKDKDSASEAKKSEYVLDDGDRADMSDYIAAEQARYAGNMTAQPGMNMSDNRAYYAEPAPQSTQFNNNYMSPHPAQQPMNGYEGGYGSPQPGYVRPNYDPQTAHDALYSSFSSSPTTPSAPSQSSFSPYVQPQNVQTENATRISDYEAAQAGRTDRETPKIFRMRSNPNILVYEYSDRYEKYEQLANGDRRRVSIEYK